MTGAWDRLREEMAGGPGTALVSMEHLGPVRPRKVRHVVETLAGSRVEVVLTGRDLNRNLVAMWQETVQNGRAWTWEDYRRGARADAPGPGGPATAPSEAGRTFWRQQDLARMVQTWGSVVGPAHVSLVTVPPPGADRELLWSRYAEAVGFDPATATRPTTAANESIGAASALALRRLNELLDERGLAFPAGSRERKFELAKRILARRRDVEPALGLVVEPWVREAAEHTVAELRASGARLVGAWSDLEPVDAPGLDPADIPGEEVAEAALAGLAGMLANRIAPA